MIVSYRDKKTERFANGEEVKEFSGFARQAEVRLDRLEVAGSLKDLAALRGNRLEVLRGDRQGQYSIRINGQWPICFEWPKESPGPIDVEITDYMARTPIHPGEHLAEELKELGISAAELARQIDVPVNRVTGIINGQRSVTADTALRLGHWFGAPHRARRVISMLRSRCRPQPRSEAAATPNHREHEWARCGSATDSAWHSTSIRVLAATRDSIQGPA
jgi:proteic killer suppression protein